MSAGARLKESRIKAGYESATAAARASGFNENTFRSHENGARGIKVHEAARYAEAFGIDAGWLLTGSGLSDASRADPDGMKDHRVPVMMTAAEVIAIDDWSFANRVRSRSEAIRQLCALGLVAAKMETVR